MSFRSRAFVTVCVLPFALCAVAVGEEANRIPSGPLARALRGAKDIVISPLEVPATVRRVATERDFFFASWAGTLEGFGNGLARFTAGTVELLTAPVPGNLIPVYDKKLGERAFPPARPPIGMTRP
jgi:hypothetical protein